MHERAVCTLGSELARAALAFSTRLTYIIHSQTARGITLRCDQQITFCFGGVAKVNVPGDQTRVMHSRLNHSAKWISWSNPSVSVKLIRRRYLFVFDYIFVVIGLTSRWRLWYFIEQPEVAGGGLQHAPFISPTATEVNCLLFLLEGFGNCINAGHLVKEEHNALKYKRLK